MMWNYGDERWRTMHDGDGVGWLMVILMLVIAVAVVVAVVALMRGMMPRTATGTTATGAHVQDARKILQERFARGDIDEDDFRARMRALDDTGAAGG